MQILKINGECKSSRPAFKANPIPKKEADHLNNAMMKANTVDIFCHTVTDEDSFNSAKTLYLYLEKMGKTPRIITSDEPAIYGYDRNKYNILTFDEVNSDTKKSDLAACVDFSKKERVSPNVLKYLETYNQDKIIGFDHHSSGSDVISNTMKIVEQYKSVADIPMDEPKNYYVDTTAKSCSAVLYRFFKAINQPISKEQLRSVFCGMSDDMNKNRIVKFLNDSKLKYTPKIQSDDNTREVYDEVSSKLDESEKKEIISHLDVMSKLSEKEKSFYKRLFRDIKLSDNKKFAYVEIAPDDPQWLELGDENKTTSSMLREFRVNVLENDPEDSEIGKDLHEKLKDVQAVAAFYSNTKENIYKISIHTNNDYAKKYNDYIRENLCSNLTAGGHANRGGGRIFSLDNEKCHEWANYFKTASENIEY